MAILQDINLDILADMIIEKLNEKFQIPVEASGRHVHLSKEAIETLFGEGYELTRKKDLSQPGQYACAERVSLIGPKGIVNNIAVLGPARKECQVELSLTDAVSLGVKVPVRESGKLDGSAPITIATEKGQLTLNQGAIAAKRHIHVHPDDAVILGVKDKDIVSVEVCGDRPLIFHDVVIRVSENYKTFMHIDYDEANACGYKKGTFARIIK